MGDKQQPSVVAVGDAIADVCVDRVLAAEHKVLVVSDATISVDILIGRSWLDLPHIQYHKQGGELILESTSDIDTSVLVTELQDDECDMISVAAIGTCRDPIVASDVNIGPHVSAEQQVVVLELINEFRDVFAKNLQELGCSNVLEMDINEVPLSAPVRSKPYRTSPTDRAKISQILREWREAGIISDSNSPYVTPVLLVNKSSGEKWLCVDYRRLKDQIIN